MAMEKFNASEAEDRLYKTWEATGCFTAGANAKPGAPSYCIMIPPPNVTGVLHMGHAFNNTSPAILFTICSQQTSTSSTKARLSEWIHTNPIKIYKHLRTQLSEGGACHT